VIPKVTLSDAGNLFLLLNIGLFIAPIIISSTWFLLFAIDAELYRFFCLLIKYPSP